MNYKLVSRIVVVVVIITFLLSPPSLFSLSSPLLLLSLSHTSSRPPPGSLSFYQQGCINVISIEKVFGETFDGERGTV